MSEIQNDMQLIRQPTVAGQEMVVEFPVTFVAVRIINYTDDDVYVGFNEGLDQGNMALVESGAWRDFNSFNSKGLSRVYISPAGTNDKGVEVECLRW